MCIYVKDTTYTVDTDLEPGCTGPKKRFASNREKKEMYMPAEFKDGYQEKNINEVKDLKIKKKEKSEKKSGKKSDVKEENE